MGEGKSPSEIAAELSLSVKTISTYRGRILQKLDLKTSAEIMQYAIQNGLTLAE
jgi:DNA-binding CsgD family transcriptional regulator